MYVALHTHSYYSLLDGVPSPEELVARAARYEMPALALTDHDALYGLPRFVKAAERAGVKPIIGAELTLANGGGHLTLLAENGAGYANLCRLITLARRDQQKGLAALPWRLLANHAAGVIALSGCRRGEIARALLERDFDAARRAAERFAAIFGKDSFFLELQRHHARGDRRVSDGLALLAQQLGLRLAATGNVHYLDPDDAPVHDLLTCIHHRAPLDRAGGLLRSNREYFFRSPQDMAALFAGWPDALQATLDIAERCNATPPIGPQTLPRISTPGGFSAIDYLRHLCEESLARKHAERYATSDTRYAIRDTRYAIRDMRYAISDTRYAISDTRYAIRDTRYAIREYRAALDHELSIIGEQNLAGYFLVVWDVMRFARSRGILCQGRGSAANALVSYLLGISPIDPLSAGLVFERFLSRERASPPDIDVDFAADRREEVLQYLYRTYGHDHAAMACTVVTFGARQAVRDAGMALGFPQETLDRMSDSLDERSAAGLPSSPGLRARFGAQLDSPRWQQLLALAARLDGFPRHLGIHNGGMVLSALPLAQQIPIEPAAMEDRTVVQWDKDALDLMGWIKLDVLGLRALSALSDACDIVAAQTGRRPDLGALPLDDPEVYALIRRGETIGVFQVESRAQASLIPRFQPRNFDDLTIEISLIRPGPVQGGMVHPYLDRRDGREPVRYLHPLLQPALEETLGIVLFQEQVLKVARDLAGFTPGEGELLRRALGNKRAREQIESFRERFLAGARAKGVPPHVARQVFEQLAAFGGYSFARSHAGAFAVLTYWSAWLKRYHPLAFFAGILRNEPMGFYPPHVIVSDAMRSGVKLLGVDVRYSQARTVVEGDAIRLGLDYVHGFGPAHIETLIGERERRRFASLASLIERTGLDRPRLEALVQAGALDYLGERRQLLWDLAEAFRLAKRPPELPLKSPDEQVQLPPMDSRARLSAAYAFTGVSLEGHLAELRRDAFTRAGARSIGELPQLRHGQRVRVGGLVVALQRPPTANGYAFLALEDPSGMVNVVIAPQVYAQCREALHAAFVIVDGAVQKDHGAIDVIAAQVQAI